MRVAVGCPVKNRRWALFAWFQFVDRAFEQAGVEPYFLFVCGTSVDGTEDMLGELMRGRPGKIVWTEEEPALATTRVWGPERYSQMVTARNLLLDEVRNYSPDYFLSVDSDILLHQEVVGNLIETIQDRAWDAVGGMVYLTPPPSTRIVNVTKPLAGSSGSLHRIVPTDRTSILGPPKTKVGHIMALKLMAISAYHVDYCTHYHGEDIGWSERCRSQGLQLGFDARAISKHVMTEHWLTNIDSRVGW